MTYKPVRSPISFFIPALNGGGAQRVIINLANALVELTDHPIHVVLIRAEGELLHLLRDEVQVFNLAQPRTAMGFLKLASYLRKHCPAALMSRLDYANIVAMLAWYLSGRGTRIVLSEANIVRPPKGSPLNRIRQTLLIKLMRLFYPRAHQVVANSEGTKQSLVAHNIVRPDTVQTIGNPIIPSPPDTRPSACNNTQQLTSEQYICAIGRLVEQKGFDILLDAFAQLENTNHHLVILGEGPLRNALAEQARVLGIEDRLHMPGFVSSPERVLAHASLFVLSSRWEGFGNVLVEALATGTPVVSTDCPGAPRDILNGGLLGHLVPPENARALAAAIDDALVAPRATPEQRISRAYDFSATQIALEYLELFEPSFNARQN